MLLLMTAVTGCPVTRPEVVVVRGTGCPWPMDVLVAVVAVLVVQFPPASV